MSSTDAVRVDPTNTEQLQAWDGDEGAYWAAHTERFDRSLAGHHRGFLAAASIDAADRVLDVGCGTGQTTRDAARLATTGSALGVDLSARMVEHARLLAAEESVTNAVFEQADAQIHPFEAGSHDVAIGRTSAMFFGDQVAALANVGRALRPGGRLVLLTWRPRSENEWMREIPGALAAGRDLPVPPPDRGPFSLSDPARIREVLTAAGFVDIDLRGTSTGMWFGADVDDAHGFVLGLLGWMLAELDDGGRARAESALRESMAAHLTADGVVYQSATWTIRGTRP